MIQLKEVFKVVTGMSTDRYGIREIWINPANISMIQEDTNYKRFLGEGKMESLGLVDSVDFLKLTVDGRDVVVAGAKDFLIKEFSKASEGGRASKKAILKG